MLDLAIGVSTGSWLQSANSTIADALDGHPGLHRYRAINLHHVLGLDGNRPMAAQRPSTVRSAALRSNAFGFLKAPFRWG